MKILIITLSLAVIVFGGGYLLGWWHIKTDGTGSSGATDQEHVYTPPPPATPAKPQSIRIWAKPCATAGDPSTWSENVDLAGLCQKDAFGNYLGDPVDPNLYNYGGRPPVVDFHWKSDNPNVTICGVINNDFNHPVIPFPESISTVDTKEKQPRKPKTARFGTSSREGAWVTVSFTVRR